MKIFLFCDGVNIASKRWCQKSILDGHSDSPKEGERLIYKRRGGKKEIYQVEKREWFIEEDVSCNTPYYESEVRINLTRIEGQK